MRRKTQARAKKRDSFVSLSSPRAEGKALAPALSNDFQKVEPSWSTAVHKTMDVFFITLLWIGGNSFRIGGNSFRSAKVRWGWSAAPVRSPKAKSSAGDVMPAFPVISPRCLRQIPR
jgi:hypothetical protein